MTRHTTRTKQGRYSYAGQWDRVCKCGAALGEHTAAPPHSHDATGCEKFRLKNMLDTKGSR